MKGPEVDSDLIMSDLKHLWPGHYCVYGGDRSVETCFNSSEKCPRSLFQQIIPDGIQCQLTILKNNLFALEDLFCLKSVVSTGIIM